VDTPCARATILAQRWGAERVRDTLTVALDSFRQRELQPWMVQEQQWGVAWESMLRELPSMS
jgi:hypothetical protein